jgi:hypothetical protein
MASTLAMIFSKFLRKKGLQPNRDERNKLFI